TLPLTPTPAYSDGGHGPALAAVHWTSSDHSVLTVTPAGGLVTAVGAGSATVTATSGPISGSTTIRVTAATLSGTGLTVTPSPATVALGETLPLSAHLSYSDGTNPDVTAGVGWTSGTPANATVSTTGSGPDAPGVVRGLQAGASTITATVPWQVGGTSPTATT